MSIWSSFKALILTVLGVISEYSRTIGLVAVDFASLVPLLIIMFSYYRLSTFRTLLRLYKHSYLHQPSQAMSNNNHASRKTRSQNITNASISKKGFLKRTYLRYANNLGAARKCGMLIILDVLALPFSLIFLVILNDNDYELHSQITKLERLKENSKSAEECYTAEKDLIYLRFVSGSLTMLKITLIVLTIYNIPKLCIASYRVFSLRDKTKKRECSLIKQIDVIFKESSDNCIRVLSGAIIVICVVRIKSTLQRFRVRENYLVARQKMKEAERLRREGSNTHWLSLDDMTWDIYGRICNYLTITDLARLSRVNKKLNLLANKDFYWEYQFNRDWIAQGNTLKTPSFRQKCISAYKNANISEIKPALTVRERDRLCGSAHIMLDEAVNSLKALPWIFLIPANMLSWLIVKLLKPARANEHYLYPRNRNVVDHLRPNFVADLKKGSLNILAPTWQNFHLLHLDLQRWLSLARHKIISEVSYLVSYIGYIIIKTTSAGGYNPMIVEHHQDTDTITVTPGVFEANENQNVTLRFTLYCIQLVITCAYIWFFELINFWPVYQAAFRLIVYLDPENLIILFIVSDFHNRIFSNVALTNQNLIQLSAPFFKPWEPFKICYAYLRNLCRRVRDRFSRYRFYFSTNR